MENDCNLGSKKAERKRERKERDKERERRGEAQRTYKHFYSIGRYRYLTREKKRVDGKEIFKCTEFVHQFVVGLSFKCNRSQMFICFYFVNC